MFKKWITNDVHFRKVVILKIKNVQSKKTGWQVSYVRQRTCGSTEGTSAALESQQMQRYTFFEHLIGQSAQSWRPNFNTTRCPDEAKTVGHQT